MGVYKPVVILDYVVVFFSYFYNCIIKLDHLDILKPTRPYNPSNILIISSTYLLMDWLF